MDSNSFWKFYLIFCRDANSGLGSGKELFFFSGAGFLTTLRSESDILSDSGSPTGSLLHHTPSWEFLLNWYDFLWNFCWNRFLLRTTISDECLLVQNSWPPNFIHFILRSRSRKFWKYRSWIQTFYLRLLNPGCHTWMLASISLVMVVQSNFCNRDFLTDHIYQWG